MTRSPASLPSGPVLIVGDGASGRDIAIELASTRETWLAIGKPRRLFPERILGRSIWQWLSTLGLLRVGPDSWLGKRMRKVDPFPDRGRSLKALKRAGVRVVPRLTAARGARATFADGQTAEVGSVVWCVGYRDDFGWIDVAGAKDRTGAILQTEGVSPVSGLYFVGRPWQRNRASALVMGAGEDARRIVEHVTPSFAGRSPVSGARN